MFRSLLFSSRCLARLSCLLLLVCVGACSTPEPARHGPPPSHAIVQAGETALYVEWTRSGEGLRGRATGGDVSVDFEVVRGPKTPLELRQLFADTPPYEVDVRFQSADGEVFLARMGGHSFVRPQWRADAAAQFHYREQVAPSTDDMVRRQAEFALIATLRPLLEQVDLPTGLAVEEDALALLLAHRERVASERHAAAAPSSESTGEPSLGLDALGTVAGALQSFTFQHEQQIRRKGAYFSLWGLNPFDHSATLNRSYKLYGSHKVEWQEIITCNHGACADQCDDHCAVAYTDRTANLPPLSQCGEDTTVHVGGENGCCPTEYRILPDNYKHVCNDDSTYQRDAVKNGTFFFTPQYCGDTDLQGTAPSCPASDIGVGWSCDSAYYFDGSQCHCGCGIQDLDCLFTGCSTPGCSAAACDVCFDGNGEPISCNGGVANNPVPPSTGANCDLPQTPVMPKLPFPAGVSFGLTQGFQCLYNTSCLGNGHVGSYAYSLDFNKSDSSDVGIHVLAALPGDVVYVENDVAGGCGGCGGALYNGGWGNVVILDHGNGVFSKYAHLEHGSVQVSVGDFVAQGQYMGRVGSTGNSTGSHLHFQLQSSGGLNGTSIPFSRFVETSSVPVCGGSYTSANAESSGCEETIATDGWTIIDDTSPCFRRYQFWESQSTGFGGQSWWTNTWGGTTFGDTQPNGGTPDSYAKWTLNFVQSGDYEIQVYIPSANATSQTAKYKIFSPSVGEYYKTISQAAHAGTWATLGTWVFQGGGAGALRLNDNTGEAQYAKKLAADAIRVRRVQGTITYQEGTAYKSSSGPDICWFMNGFCYHLADQDAYAYFDADSSGSVEISPAAFEELVSTSPCSIGSDYDDPQHPGCLHEDAELVGGAGHYLLAGAHGRRVPDGAIDDCFDAGRIVATPGFASALGLEFDDVPESPTYCDPGFGAQEVPCGPCKVQIGTCHPTSCTPQLTACFDLCSSAQVCVESVCEAVQLLVPGEINSPGQNETVANTGFNITWLPGSSTTGIGASTGLFCMEDDGDWTVVVGFGATTSTWYFATQPGTSVACKLRTRLDSDYSEWVESEVVTWFSATTTPNMVVENVEVPLSGDVNVCSSYGVVATIRNTGSQLGTWEARAYIHPAGQSWNGPGAIPAKESRVVTLGPAESGEFAFAFGVASPPIPAASGDLEVTVRVADAYAGSDAADQHSLDFYFADTNPPEIPLLQVYAFGPQKNQVLPGQTHSVRVNTVDNFGLADLALEWRVVGGEFVGIPLSNSAPGCPTAWGDWPEWSVPSNLPVGADLEIRARATDLAGNTVEKTVVANVVADPEYQVVFTAPLQGEVYTAKSGVCVPVNLVFAPAANVAEFGLGFTAGETPNPGEIQSIGPVPADGHVSLCLPSPPSGDDVTVVARIIDVYNQQHWFFSNPLQVNFPAPSYPWRPVHLDSSQVSWPPPVGASYLSQYVAFGWLSGSDNLIAVGKREVMSWKETGAGELIKRQVSTLQFDLDSLGLVSNQAVIPAWTEAKPALAEWAGGELTRYSGGGIWFQDRVINTSAPGTNCHLQGCDFTFEIRQSQGGPLSPWLQLGVYEQRAFPPSSQFGVQPPGGPYLLGVTNWKGTDYKTDVYRNVGSDWSLLKAIAPTIEGFVSMGQAVWALRTQPHSNGSGFDATVFTVDPTTGSEGPATVLFTVEGGFVQWFVAEDLYEDALVAVLYDFENGIARFMRNDGNGWQAQAPSAIPSAWRGHPLVGQQASRIGFSALGTLWMNVGVSWDEEYQDLLVPMTPGVPIDFGDGVSDFDTNGSAGHGLIQLPDGRLARARTCDWNLEPRLCIDISHPLSGGCFDDNPCTIDSWNAEAGVCVHTAVVCDSDGDACNGPEVCDPVTGQCGSELGQALVCDDGNACNGVESCDPASGTCLSGTPPNVDDGFSCTTDVCAEATGEILHIANDDACLGDLCHTATCAPDTVGAQVGTGCVPAALPVASDFLECTADLCDPATGQAIHVPVEGFCVIDQICRPAGQANPLNPCEWCEPEASASSWSPHSEGESCDDGKFCTVDDACTAGSCMGQARDCSASVSDAQCQSVSCDEIGDSCKVAPHANGAPCGDGQPCNGAETCQQGSCTAGAPPNVDDGDPCTDDSCVPGLGVLHVLNTAPCSLGSGPCAPSGTCSAGVCVATGAPDCSDLDGPCTVGSCQPTGETTYACVAVTAPLEGAPCDADGDGCTVGDACVSGVCAPGTPPDCSEADGPCAVGLCESTGADSFTCVSQGGGQGGQGCDDGNPCTVDVCMEGQGCVFIAVVVPCDDGDACTAGDLCGAGKCKAGASVVCDDGDPCTVDGCEPASGCAVVDVLCDDGDACTVDECTPTGQCEHSPTDCDDGEPCTDDDCASATGCTWTAKNCDDGEPCTVDQCAPGVGCLTTPLHGIPCNDGSACTVLETCTNGVCMGGLQVDCTDDDACTVNDCLPASGCEVTPTSCDDGNSCTADGCDAEQGCTHAALHGSFCDDSDACTILEACDAGVCAGGYQVDCDDDDPCTVDACDPAAGCTHAGDLCNADCCLDSLASGCESAACEACVCQVDPFCCDANWDGDCVGLAGTDCAAPCGCAPPPNGCSDTHGDVDGSDTIGVVDVQCLILASLAAITGATSAPACLADELISADLNCDLDVSVADVLLVIQYSLAIPLDVSVDADGNSCPDACEP